MCMSDCLSVSLSMSSHRPFSYVCSSPGSTTGVPKGCCISYPVCGMVHIKDPLLMSKSSQWNFGSWFPLSLSLGVIYPTPHEHKQNVLRRSLNK